MTAPKLDYMPHVDGLRAIAITTVVLYHAWPSALTGGFIGVDVFFVISGFLITRLIITELQSGQFSLWEFYARRVRRLMPAAVVMCIVVSAAAAWILLPDALRHYGHSLTAASLLVSNLHFANNVGYFDGEAHEKPLLHTWSLAVEEQFYLIWPLVLLLAFHYRAQRGLLWLCALGAAASILSVTVFDAIEPQRKFFMLHARAWELMLGAMTAVWLMRGNKPAPSPIVAEPIALAALGAVLASTVYVNAATDVPGLALIPACLGTAVLIAIAKHAPGVGRVLAAPPLVWCGLISYSLYLWHWPIFSLARYHVERPLSTGELGLLIGASVVIAAASWRYVERPFRINHKAAQDAEPVQSKICMQILLAKLAPSWPRGSRVRFAAAVVAITAVLAGLGGAMNGGRGWPWRYSGEVQTLLAQMSRGNPLRPRCGGSANAFSDNAGCNFGSGQLAAGGFDVAIFGDSNADHFVPGLATIAQRAGWRARQVTQSQCGPLLGFKNTNWNRNQVRHCANYQRVLIRFIDANPNLRLVVLAAHWQRYAFRPQPGLGYRPTEGILQSPTTNAAATIAQTYRNWPMHEQHRWPDVRYYMRRTVAFLRARNIHVLIIGQVPHIDGGLPIRCVIRALQAATPPTRCGIAAPSVRAALGPSNSFLTELARQDGVTVTLPSDVMCDAHRCSIIQRGVFAYRDLAHLSMVGSIAVADALFSGKLEQPMFSAITRSGPLR